jgi:prepilin-type processing-associated H-X9-DG protein
MKSPSITEMRQPADVGLRQRLVILLRAGCLPRLPGTPHRGGMQAVMADGSARVFGPGTSPWMFWVACEPAKPPAGP